jgi:signal transduction histidine kinase/CheY-like chemotaxis protein
LVLAALLLKRGGEGIVTAAAWAGNVIANLSFGDSIGGAVMLAFSNTVEIIVAVAIIRRQIDDKIDLSRRRDLVVFIGAALVASIGSAIFASIQLNVLGRNLPVEASVWATADALGLIILTPALLALARARQDLAKRPITLSGLASLLVLVAASTLVFGFVAAPMLFVLVPAVLWVVFKLERLGAAIAVMLVAIVGVGATLLGRGPVGLHGSGTEALFLLQSLLAVLAVTSLSIASVLMERGRLQEELTHAHLKIQASQEKELQHQQAARAAAEAAAQRKANFLADMTHELRTPLTSILGFVGIAMEADAADVNRHLQRVRDAADDLLRIVNDLLDFSKLEAGQLPIHREPTRVCVLGRRTLDLLEPQAREKGLALHLDCDLDLVLAIDPHRLRQILTNYLSNAIKFTPTGAVTLRFAYASEASQLRVEVIDTGSGIAADQLSTLFDRYAQADGQSPTLGGTGLGLAICRQLAEAMGGSVGVRSTLGSGSAFWATVAAEPAEDRGSEDEIVASDLNAAGRLLIADDHAANRDIVKHLISQLGFEVSEAADGGEAVELALSQPFDLILMDVRMPRLEGGDATRLIRRRSGPNQKTPILAFTADAAPNEADLRAQGFSGYVEKPIDPRQMLQAMSAALRIRSDEG